MPLQSPLCVCRLLFENAQDVLFLDDQVIRAVHVDLAAGILVEQDDIPDLHRLDIGPDGFDLASLGVLLGSIRDVDSARCAFQLLRVADKTPMLERYKSCRDFLLLLLLHHHMALPSITEVVVRHSISSPLSAPAWGPPDFPVEARGGARSPVRGASCRDPVRGAAGPPSASLSRQCPG